MSLLFSPLIRAHMHTHTHRETRRGSQFPGKQKDTTILPDTLASSPRPPNVGHNGVKRPVIATRNNLYLLGWSQLTTDTIQNSPTSWHGSSGVELNRISFPCPAVSPQTYPLYSQHPSTIPNQQMQHRCVATSRPAGGRDPAPHRLTLKPPAYTYGKLTTHTAYGTYTTVENYLSYMHASNGGFLDSTTRKTWNWRFRSATD